MVRGNTASLPSTLTLWIVDMNLDIDLINFKRVVLKYSNSPNDDQMLEAYREELFPVVADKPVPRIEAWMPSDEHLRIILLRPYYATEFESVYQNLKKKYDDYTARLKVMALSWANFVERSYGPGGAGFVNRVKNVKAQKTRVSPARLSEPVREWLEELYKLEKEGT